MINKAMRIGSGIGGSALNPLNAKPRKQAIVVKLSHKPELAKPSDSPFTSKRMIPNA